MKYRSEHDMLGEMQIPSGSYYGIHSARAARNFSISDRKVRPEIIQAMGTVKKACCLANRELGFLSPDIADAISAACDEVAAGLLHQEFITDALQGGAGTSVNMNVNEVIANRALELLGKARGQYDIIDPLEHVNLHQSTNDVFPTALKVAVIRLLRELSPLLAQLQETFQRREQEFAAIVKIGRTEMQDAVPMTLGAEFAAFAEAFARDRWRSFKAEERIRVVNLGGTAIGTGLTAPRSYIFLVIEKLRALTGFGLSRGENCVDQTANQDAFVEVSAILKAAAVNMMKVARDLRQLHFIGEIKLTPVQAGSSIMPGKVNPVIPESIIQAAMKVSSYDLLIEQCAAHGTLQLNEYMPLLADSIIASLTTLRAMTRSLESCAASLNANPGRCQQLFDSCPTVITAFLPQLGYQKTLELLTEFNADPSMGIRAFLDSRLDTKLVERVLNPQNLVALGYR